VSRVSTADLNSSAGKTMLTGKLLSAIIIPLLFS
jgi:hypothetical protein